MRRADRELRLLVVLLVGCGARTAAPLARPTAATSASVAGSATAATPAAAPPPAPRPAASVAPVPLSSSTVAVAKVVPAWAGCARAAPANVDPSMAVLEAATACEAATHLKPIGRPIAERQSDTDKPQSFALAAQANHCYRVYVRAAAGITDLSAAIEDSAGVVVGQGAEASTSATGLKDGVLEDGAVCFQRDDRARVVVSVGMGGGAYALQVSGD